MVRNADEFASAIRRELIDVVLIDLGAPGDEQWKLAAHASDFPSTPFFGLLPYRTTDTESIARASAFGFADVLCEQVDESSARDLIAPLSYSGRFARTLNEAPEQLGLTTDTQRRTWQAIIQHAGRPVTTTMLAAVMGVTREHLSRNFARDRGANLKRVIDLVRLISAAELSKNPGYDVRDVAAVLGFASSSHLAVTTQRIASTRPASLSGLRAVDLIDRFVQGRTRSRVAVKGSL
jgi:AraC-like DNA-binding protein